jgi:ribosomal-protein-alanine N-acetyltransferase
MLRALAATLRGRHAGPPPQTTGSPLPLVRLSNAPETDDPLLRIEGPRVWLRPLEMGDAAAMFGMASDPVVTRFLPWVPAPGIEAVRPFLAEMIERRRRGDSLPLAIVWRETGEMIGSTDLMNLRAVRGQGELGYLLARPFWGRGVMTEAAGLTLAHAFDVLRLSRVTAFADAENAGSRRVLEKIGMRPWGTEERDVKGERRVYVRYEAYRTRPD